MPQADKQETRSSIVLLQNVLVLAVGIDTGGGEAEEKSDKRSVNDLLLSLSVNVPEAQLLALALEKGTITVALRNPDDVRIAGDNGAEAWVGAARGYRDAGVTHINIGPARSDARTGVAARRRGPCRFGESAGVTPAARKVDLRRRPFTVIPGLVPGIRRATYLDRSPRQARG